VIAVLLLAGWLLFNTGLFSATNRLEPVPPLDKSVLTTGQTQQKLSNTEKASLTIGGENKKGNVRAKNLIYGLNGKINPKAKDGYTIIVHSLIRKDKALKTLEAIKAKGYRAFIAKVRVNDRLYWRIGIG